MCMSIAVGRRRVAAKGGRRVGVVVIRELESVATLQAPNLGVFLCEGLHELVGGQGAVEGGAVLGMRRE